MKHICVPAKHPSGTSRLLWAGRNSTWIPRRYSAVSSWTFHENFLCVYSTGSEPLSCVAEHRGPVSAVIYISDWDEQAFCFPPPSCRESSSCWRTTSSRTLQRTSPSSSTKARGSTRRWLETTWASGEGENPLYMRFIHAFWLTKIITDKIN